MLRTITLVITLAFASLLFAQGYTPKAGETVMKVSVQRAGDVYILLHTKEAPKTTQHIIGLVDRGFYDNQRFFRVVKEPRPFLVQFGDPGSKSKSMDDDSLGKGGSGKRIPYEETGFTNVVGAVGLATQQDANGNNLKDSGDSQFYILLANSRFLNGSSTVFGKVVQGMDVVSRIKLGDQVTSVTILRG